MTTWKIILLTAGCLALLLALVILAALPGIRLRRVGKALQEILEDLEPEYIRGFSLLGGEPFEPANQEVLVGVLRHIRERYPKKTIWCYSGYLFDHDMLAGKLGDPAITREMLGYLDVLVDGEFVESKKNLNLRFKGSENQRIINVPKSLETGTIVLWDGEEYA